jgi:hypothetical protein
MALRKHYSVYYLSSLVDLRYRRDKTQTKQTSEEIKEIGQT